MGSGLVHHLVEEGIRPEQVRVFFLPDTPTAGVADLPGLDLFPGNILDPGRVAEALAGVRWVFHMVGNTSFDPFRKESQWRVNVEGTRNLLEACLAREGVEKIVYTSTVNTLGAPDPPGSLGDETTDPYSAEPKFHSFASSEAALAFADGVHAGTAPRKWWKELGIGYFDSKLAAQELVSRAARDQGLPVASVLPGTIFGPYDHFVGNGIYLVRIYHNAMPGYTPGGGFPLTHVRDVARGHALVMKRGQVGRRYIISGREEDNLYLRDMLRVVAEVVQAKCPDRRIKVPRREFPLRVVRVGARLSEWWAWLRKKPCLLSRDALRAGSFPSFYSHARARHELGYAPRYSFREAVEDMFDYYQLHGLLDTTARLADAR